MYRNSGDNLYANVDYDVEKYYDDPKTDIIYTTTLNEENQPTYFLTEERIVGYDYQPLKNWSDPNGMSAEGFGEYKESYWEAATRLMQMKEEGGPLTYLFFSNKNVNYIQKRIIDEVKKVKGITIARQSDDDLLQLMVDIYIQNTRQSGRTIDHLLIHGEHTVTEFISDLNKAVLNEAVAEVLNGVDMWLEYNKQISSLPLPLTQPTYATDKGSRSLSYNTGFYDGYSQDVTAYNMQMSILPQTGVPPAWFDDSSFDRLMANNSSTSASVENSMF